MIGRRSISRVAVIAAGIAALSSRAPAQVREPGDTASAGEHAGPLADISRPLGDDSAAVHDGSQTIGESSGGSIADGAASVHEPNAPTVLSGPVSSISRGPVDAVPASIALAVEEASAGAVTHDLASPLGEQISEPLRELGPLRAQMRKQREEAQRIALQQSIAPVVADAPEASAPDATMEAPPVAPDQHADAEFTPPSDGLDPEGDLHGEDAPAPDDPDSSN